MDPSKQDDRHAPGKNLSVGSIVRLCGLTSPKGQKMNESVAEIVDGHREDRFGVKIIQDNGKNANGHDKENAIRIKTMNMRLVCSNCFQDKKKLQFCILCKIVGYCGKQCQADHWKLEGPRQHKRHCAGKKNKSRGRASGDKSDSSSPGFPNVMQAQELQQRQSQNQFSEDCARGFGKFSASPNIKWAKSMDHPSWSKLTQPIRHCLRRHHARSSCVVPWPVCVETPAMLDDPYPSFLIVHPNQRFVVDAMRLPGFHAPIPILQESKPHELDHIDDVDGVDAQVLGAGPLACTHAYPVCNRGGGHLDQIRLC